MYNIKIFFLFFKSAGRVYHFIGIGGLMILSIKILWLNDIQAPFHFMSKISNAFEGVLGSIIASYIFYLFCIHPSVFEEKRTRALFLDSMLNRITSSFQSYINGTSVHLNSHSSLSDVREHFSTLDPFQNNAPLTFGMDERGQFLYADWFDFFSYNNDKILDAVKKLLDSKMPLDINMINQLNSISNCQWFMIIKKLSELKSQLNTSSNPFYNSINDTQICDDFYELKEMVSNIYSLRFEVRKFIIN
jgi:hypothetical protein